VGSALAKRGRVSPISRFHCENSPPARGGRTPRSNANFTRARADALEAVEGLVPSDGVFDDGLDLDPGAVERDQDRNAFHLGGHLFDVLA